MSLFVGVAVYRIVQKIGPHPQIIEQGVALRWGPIAGKAFALLCRLEDKCQAPAFSRFDFLSKGQIRLHTLQSCGLFTPEDVGDPRVNRMRRILPMLHVDAQGTTM